jgi:hypothetical protein
MDSAVVPTKVHDAGPARHHVIAQPRHRHDLPVYFIPDTDLEMGSSLGNTRCWLTTKGTGDVESLFSTHLGQAVVGATCLRYSGVGHRIIRPGRHEEAVGIGLLQDQAKAQANGLLTSDEEAIPLPGVLPEAQQYALHDGMSTAFIHLRQEMPGQFELHPAYQRHRYDLPGGLKVEETVFVPHVAAPTVLSGRRASQSCLARATPAHLWLRAAAGNHPRRPHR